MISDSSFFPVLSLIATVAVSAAYLGLVLWTNVAFGPPGPGHARKPDSTISAVLFLFYFLNYFVATFFNAALVGAAGRFLDGLPATVGDGLREAGKRVGQIAQWALLATTVALVLSIIRRRSGQAGRIATGILSISWSLVTYLVVPVLIFENRSAWGAVDRSRALCRKVWGEEVSGSIGFGLIWFLISLPALAGGFVSVRSHLLPGVAAAILYFLLVMTLSSTTKGIFTVALYRYASQAEWPSWFSGPPLSDLLALPTSDATLASEPEMSGTLLEVLVIPLEENLERGELYTMRIEAGEIEYHASYALGELASGFRADSWKPGTPLRLRVDGERLLISGPGCPRLSCDFLKARAHRSV